MSSIVTGILSSTVGLLWNKTRDWTAAKLNDGDVTDAKIREIVVRELNDIKTKLDGLSRKDLLTSYRYLREGVDLLSVCLDKSKLEQKVATYPNQENCGEASTMSSGAETSDILNEALELSHAMGKMKIYSDKEFESAKKRFKDARKKATEAFCNEALSTQDRIFAAKLRIVSEILECLENPETAITGCLSFLQELHSLPAVREIFSVYLNGGFKSLLNKAERVENVKSVMLINSVLCNLNFKFSLKFTNRVTWPGTGIELTDRSFNPILDWQKVSSRKSMGEDLLSQPPNKVILDPPTSYTRLTTVYSHHGDVVVIEYVHPDYIIKVVEELIIKVVSVTGDSKVIELPKPRESKFVHVSQYIIGLAVDNNNIVYVVRGLSLGAPTENVVHMYSCMLNVLNKNYDAKHVCKFDLFWNIWNVDLAYLSVAMTINKNNNIILISDMDPHVYICDNTGKLKHVFQTPSFPSSYLSISNKNDILLSLSDCVYLYAEEGNLKSTIKLPEGHEVHGIAFHYVILRIIVLTYVEKEHSYFLLCYSETGELETSSHFCIENEDTFDISITSHLSGPFAVVRKKSITFI